MQLQRQEIHLFKQTAIRLWLAYEEFKTNSDQWKCEDLDSAFHFEKKQYNAVFTENLLWY